MASPLRLKLTANSGRDFTLQTPNGDGTFGCGYTASDTLTASVWSGDSTLVLATPSVIWGNNSTTNPILPASGAAITLYTVEARATDAGALPPGLYRLQVFATHGGVTATLFDGMLEVVGTAASNVPTDLASYTYVETILSRMRLRRDEREMLALLISEASDEIRKWCGQRLFNRQTLTEEYVADLNGFVWLNQMPVQSVQRVRGYLQTVLNVSAASTFAQAWLSLSTTGDWTLGTLANTGVVLSSISNGTLTTTPLLFATYPTVAQLAAAISSVAGWTANTSSPYTAYPSTDLQSNGAAQGALADDGVQLLAYTEDLTTTQLDSATGGFYVGRRRVMGGFNGGYWGDDGWDLLDETNCSVAGRVQVTYDSGFTVIPTPVQLATAELVKAAIERQRNDHRFGDEDNGVYKYKIDASLVGMLPKPVLQRLALFRISHAR